ncbi:MAG: tRNA (adenosine(37)-N6)-dimethylallyltransferase MiaA, partial [Clostridiales bacterium]|nr:tRNA (adenosine(37)-N6)-dimethylallyltransferase MiaA [Clostridiales bacterium]
SIATAKPDSEEMQGIKHYMLDFVEPYENFSVSDYVKLAHEAIKEIASKGKIAVVAGGTGLYIDSLLKNVEFTQVKTDFALRDKLMKRYEKEGIEPLFDELKAIDAQTASQLHEKDVKRIIRALEIYHTSGITMTEQKKNSMLNESPYNVCWLGLNAENRDFLYDRINRRVDIMLENGLVEEARSFFESDISSTAKQAIGYKELFPFLNGEATLEECVDKLKMETRRYAKRQLTWFRKNEAMNWLYIDKFKSFDELLENALEIIRKGGIVF